MEISKLAASIAESPTVKLNAEAAKLPRLNVFSRCSIQCLKSMIAREQSIPRRSVEESSSTTSISLMRMESLY